ncbi:Hypothetical protein EPM1_0856 [Stenotrophomonas maltophilia EPM1]|nr:Hypothetical protein EPM1_0856 [Stenotrophomonas maltophilia EPM1]
MGRGAHPGGNPRCGASVRERSVPAARGALTASLLGTASHVNAGCRRGGAGHGTAQGDSAGGAGTIANTS